MADSKRFMSKTFGKSIQVLLLAAMILVMGRGQGSAQTDPVPFQVGEKLRYVLRWGMISAGEAKMEIRPSKQMDGVDVYHFVMTTKTKGFVDVFFKLRERVDAWAETGLKRSMGYKKRQTEGEHKRDEEIVFDWKNGKAHYSNFGKSRPPIDLEPGSLDPLSVIYYTRMALFSNRMEIKRPVTDGKKTFFGKATMVRREKVTLSDGKTYDTFCVIPAMSDIGGAFEDEKDAKIYLWVTTDEACIPVKIKSKLAIGHFIGELVSAEGIRSVEKK